MSVPSVVITQKHVDGPEVARLMAAQQDPPMRTVFLGARLEPDKIRPGIVKFADFLTAHTPPEAKSWLSAAALESIKKVYGNDQEGNCVLASEFHGEGVVTAHEAGVAQLGTTQEALSEYHRICGPGDNGCMIDEVLDEAVARGILIGGKKRMTDGYAAVDPANKLAVQTAILIGGGGLRIGFNVPAEWMGSATYDGAVWDTPRRYSFVGGHDVRAVGYDAIGVQFSTWGIVVTITWAVMADRRIVDQCRVQLYKDWYTDGMAASGFDAAALKAAFDKFRQGQTPEWHPAEPPKPLAVSVSPSSGQAPLSVSVSVTGTGAVGSAVDFGDGTPIATYPGGGATLGHQYRDPGSYTILVSNTTEDATASVSVSQSPTPVPPVPPTPPQRWPEYSGEMSFRLPLLGTITGTVHLLPVTQGIIHLRQNEEKKAAAKWDEIVKAFGQLVLDIGSRNWQAVLPDILAILALLGVLSKGNNELGDTLVQLDRYKTQAASLKVSWWVLAKDVWAIYQAINARDIPSVIAAIKKLAADLGFDILPF